MSVQKANMLRPKRTLFRQPAPSIFLLLRMLLESDEGRGSSRGEVSPFG